MYTTMSSVTPWSSTIQYGVIPYNAIPVNPSISGIINIQSLVSHNNILYLCNKGVIPIINVAPPLQPEAWTQIGVVSTQLSYGLINGISSNTALSNGAVPFTGATNTSSSDVTINTTTNTILLPQKIFQLFCILRPTTDTTGNCYFNFVGTNCTVSSNLMQPNTNTANQIVDGACIITPTGANPSIQLIASSIAGSVQLNNRGTYIQFSSMS